MAMVTMTVTRMLMSNQSAADFFFPNPALNPPNLDLPRDPKPKLVIAAFPMLFKRA
jgi:hypothetical protein